MYILPTLIVKRLFASALGVALLGFGIPAANAKSHHDCPQSVSCQSVCLSCPVDPKEVRKEEKARLKAEERAAEEAAEAERDAAKAREKAWREAEKAREKALEEAEEAQHEAAEECRKQQKQFAKAQEKINKAQLAAYETGAMCCSQQIVVSQPLYSSTPEVERSKPAAPCFDREVIRSKPAPVCAEREVIRSKPAVNCGCDH